MKRRRFLGISTFAALGLLSSSHARAQIVNINDAINKSGRQRMLSQRLAKCYLQLGQGIDAERSKGIMGGSLAMFDRQLTELQHFAPTSDNKATLSECERAWQSYKQALVGQAANIQDAKRVLVLCEEVLGLAHAATAQLEKYSGTPGAKLVNMAGRQRMLSQRMAKLYQAKGWGIAAPDANVKLAASRGEFLAAINTLATYPQNTRAITDQLALARVQWIFFDNALQTEPNSVINLQLATNVATASERILEVMDTLTELYEKAS